MVEFAKPLEHIQAKTNTQTLGMEAVRAAYEVENIQTDLAVNQENQRLVKELLDSNVPNPASAGRVKSVLRRLRGKPYSSKEEVASIDKWLKEEDMQVLSWAPLRLETRVNNLTFRLEDAEDAKKYELDKIRTELTKYHGPHKKDLDELWDSEALGVPSIFKAAKAKTEAEEGNKLGWVDWIAEHSDDKTLVNILEWSAHKVEEESSTPEFQEKVERIKQGYAKGLEAAHQDGILDDYGLYYAQTRLEKTHIKTFHPLSQQRPDLNVMGTATRNGYVEIRSNTAEHTGYHEMTHEVFGVTSRVFDEATIELATKYFYEKGSDKEAPSKGPYDRHDIPGLRDLLHIADMNEKEWLRASLDPSIDGLEKVILLDQVIAERTGFNLLLFAEKDFNKYLGWAIADFGANAQHGARQMVYRDIANLRQLFEDCEKPIAPEELAMKLIQETRAGKFKTEDGAQLLQIIASYNQQAIEQQIK